jgi:hypothetical protein
MSRSLPPNLVHARIPARSARHSHGGCRVGHEAGAAPRLPGAAPLPVSTVADVPQAAANAPKRPPATVAVLTTFEGQAVFSIVIRDNAEPPRHRLFRLRQGLRTVTGGTL